MSVEVSKLTKTYDKGRITALAEIDISIKTGEIFGLIGPDGAGKSSFFRILTTLLLPDSGSATVCGHDVVKDYKTIRTITGYMPGRFSLYQDLSVQENIDFFATVFNTSFTANRSLIEDIYVQLEPFKNRPAGKLSGGMKQKLALCCALIHEPEILFLDEPTTGVDPVSRKEFWDMLFKLKGKGITIVVSTPYMDEASKCDRIALIDKGIILKVDTLDKITGSNPNQIYAVYTSQIYDVTKHLLHDETIASAWSFGESIHVTLNKGFNEQDLQRTLMAIHKDLKYESIPAGIEDVFMEITK